MRHSFRIGWTQGRHLNPTTLARLRFRFRMRVDAHVYGILLIGTLTQKFAGVRHHGPKDVRSKWQIARKLPCLHSRGVRAPKVLLPGAKLWC